jgi:hypothetical protein
MLDDDELKSTREMHGLEDNIKEIEVGDFVNGYKMVKDLKRNNQSNKET